MSDDNELLKLYAKKLWTEGCIKIQEEPFTLKSGKKSSIYLEHRSFITTAPNLKLVTELLNSIVERRIPEYIPCSVDSITSPVIVGAIGILFNRNFLLTVKEKLSHGSFENVFGSKFNKLVIVDDVTSTGGTFINAKKSLLKKNITINWAAVLATRDNTPASMLREEGITLLQGCRYSDLIKLVWEKLSLKQKNLVEFELD